MRITFEKYGKPTWFIDRLIYTFSLQMALKFNISLLVYGELSEKELFLTNAPSVDELYKLDPIYLSYFEEWNTYKNYCFSKRRGFHDLTHI